MYFLKPIHQFLKPIYPLQGHRGPFFSLEINKYDENDDLNNDETNFENDQSRINQCSGGIFVLVVCSGVFSGLYESVLNKWFLG